MRPEVLKGHRHKPAARFNGDCVALTLTDTRRDTTNRSRVDLAPSSCIALCLDVYYRADRDRSAIVRFQVNRHDRNA